MQCHAPDQHASAMTAPGIETAFQAKKDRLSDLGLRLARDDDLAGAPVAGTLELS